MADLEALKDDSSEPKFAALAKLQLDHYKFPVMMMVLAPNGSIIHSVNANEFMEVDDAPGILELPPITSMFEDPSCGNYERFLTEGLQKASAYDIKPN